MRPMERSAIGRAPGVAQAGTGTGTTDRGPALPTTLATSNR
jgi:hypothetical protein